MRNIVVSIILGLRDNRYLVIVIRSGILRLLYYQCNRNRITPELLCNSIGSCGSDGDNKTISLIGDTKISSSEIFISSILS